MEKTMILNKLTTKYKTDKKQKNTFVYFKSIQ